MREDPIAYQYLLKNIYQSNKEIFQKSKMSPVQFHQYNYVLSNPLHFIDPHGLEVKDIPQNLFESIPEYILKKIEEMTVGNVTGAACATRRCKKYPNDKHLLGDDARQECLNVFSKHMPDYPLHFSILQSCAEKCQEIVNSGGCKKECPK